jgi:DNA-binding MarR family transcriptional regulator
MQVGMRSQIAARTGSVLTPQQVKVVALLALNGAMRSSQLADAMGVSRSTMTGLIDRLEQGGWVKRGLDPLDGRSRPAEATDLGRRALRELLSSLKPSPQDIAVRLTDHELQCLVTGIGAVLRVMQSGDGGVGLC